MNDRRLDQLEREHLAYRTFRRGLRRLRDAELIIMEALAILERDQRPLGPIHRDSVNDTTAERQGFTPAQIAELQRTFEPNTDARDLPARNEHERESGRRAGE